MSIMSGYMYNDLTFFSQMETTSCTVVECRPIFGGGSNKLLVLCV